MKGWKRPARGRRRCAAWACAVLLAAALPLCRPGAAFAETRTVEPVLRFRPPDSARPTVALTFDACSGAFDGRIADLLVKNRIPATIFVTHRWLARNAGAMALLLAHPDLFEIEDHGDHHVPAVTGSTAIYGLKPAGSLAAVRAEVEGGAAAILAVTGTEPRWFRGATARYSGDAMNEIRADGFRIAGFSLNADIGASLPAHAVAKRVEEAKSGDVIIAHINQPRRPSGAGVVEGIRALSAAGTVFVRLEDVFAPPGAPRPAASNAPPPRAR